MIDRLLANNRRWAENRIARDPDYFRRLAAIQRPDYLWIGCSDSRVPANEIVDLDPGELFVHRNVGNLVVPSDLNCLSVLQFAIEHLGVRHVIVCGHYGCGAVKAALSSEPVGLAEHWIGQIRELAEDHDGELVGYDRPEARADRLCELNVAQQVRHVAATPVVRECWRRGGNLAIHGWIYGLHDGRLRDLRMTVTADPRKKR
ncbi:MAG: carbonic anhydrase [Azospirillaceae bacterium]